ncbi:Acetylxylan esterase precursor [compost metagenome]
MTYLLWPEGAPLAKGITEEDQPAITPYIPEGPVQASVIVCPGGGYGIRAEHEGEPIAKWLNGLGIAAFVLRYRVAPYPYPAALLDAQRAIRYVRLHAAEWGIQSKKVGILGFSAGGHLTSTAGTHYDLGNQQAADPIEQESCRPDAMILCYPVITMRDPLAHEGSRANLLGLSPDESMIHLLSNEEQVTADTPPTFLWHTADDFVAVENSLQFAAALSKNKVPFDLHVYEKGVHGLGLAIDDEHVGTWPDICGLWLKRNGFYL